MARSGAGTGVVVGISGGMAAASVGRTVVGSSEGRVIVRRVSGVLSMEGDRQAENRKEKRIARSIIRRIVLLYWVWSAS